MSAPKIIHDFNESIKRGAEGEKIVEAYLKKMRNVHRVVAMANNPLFYHKDVDYVVEFEDRSKIMLEVKTDSYKSGNIYYETVSNEKYNVDGCMEKTAAHWLAYYFSEFDRLYLLKMAEYKQLMDNLIKINHPAMKRKEVFNKARKAGETYKSIGYTLPLAVLEEMMPKNTIMIYNSLKEKVGELI